MDPIADLRKAVALDNYCPKCMTWLTDVHVCPVRRIVIGEAMARRIWSTTKYRPSDGAEFDRAAFERMTGFRVIPAAH